jgi:diguanylate cyclase (GGDEF)-like protein
MRLAIALNAILGSALTVVLIFANYVRKFNTDRFQRHIFCGILVFTFISMTGDFAYLLLEEHPGRTVYFSLYVIGIVFYFFQVLSYYYIVIFIDYMVFKDRKRAEIITGIVYGIIVIHAVALALNLRHHFYFSISAEDNIFSRGDKYYIRLMLSYLPVLFAVYDFTVSHTVLKKSFLVMLILLLIFPLAGSSVDLIFGSEKLVWPCLAAALLYAYFFIIRSDARLDSLTGIGNRFSFNEFTDRLSRRVSGESWAIVMIDMDNFKRINDTLGHQEGDNALRDMAAVIKKCVRGGDFAARYGGDEFVLATKAENDIRRLMERIQKAVDMQNEMRVRPYQLYISYGYDVYTTNSGRSIKDFIVHIDSLMYRHKEERRGAGVLSAITADLPPDGRTAHNLMKGEKHV